MLLLLFPLSCSQLHSVHFSEAILRWFDLGDAFAFGRASMALSNKLTMMTRFIWDPGGMLPIEPVVNLLCHRVSPTAATEAALRWFALGDEFALSSSSSCPTSLPTMEHDVTDVDDHDPFLFPAQETTMARPLTPLALATVKSTSRPLINECRGALALIQSLFQCSHPVSSWPTVPNIQQCRNNLPSPSSS